MGVTETRAARKYKGSVERKDEMGAMNETEFERLRACWKSTRQDAQKAIAPISPFFLIPQILKRGRFMREDVMKEMTIYENMFQDLFNFRRDFDQIFSRMLTVKPWTREEIHPWTEKGFAPAIETFVDKEGKKYFCRVSLPGVDPKDVEITVKGNFLTVKGEEVCAHGEGS